MLLPVFKPYIRRADMDSVLSCLISDEIGPGNLSSELTSELSRYLGLNGGFLFRDLYRAISITFDVLELKSGSRIILSPLSPGAYMEIIIEKGIIPVFVDVDPDTALFNKTELDRVLSEEIADAILLFCPLGNVDDMEYYDSIGIPVIEDISENFGATYTGQPCGSFGKISIISMEPDKLLTCGGGAGVLTKDEYIGEKLEIVCKRFSNEIFLSDINASLALIQLKNIEENLQKRDQIAEIFRRALDKTNNKTFTSVENGNKIHYSFPVILNGAMKEAKTYIMKKNIEPRKGFSRTALELSENRENLCPVASGLILRTLLLPLYPSLGKKNAEDISKVISTLP